MKPNLIHAACYAEEAAKLLRSSAEDNDGWRIIRLSAASSFLHDADEIVRLAQAIVANEPE